MNSCSLVSLVLSLQSFAGDDLRVLIRLIIKNSVELSLGVSIESIGLLVVLELSLSVLSRSGVSLEGVWVAAGKTNVVRDQNGPLHVGLAVLIEPDGELVALRNLLSRWDRLQVE